MLRKRTDGAESAVDFFKEAIELDPSFATAYAGLGYAYVWLAYGYYLPSHEAFPEARRYAEDALRIDSSLAYAKSLIGAVDLWYAWEWEAAKKILQEATELNPSEAGAYLDLGWYFAVKKDFDESIKQLRKALEFDPLHFEYNVDLADIYRMSGQLEEALDIGQTILETYPSNSDTHWLLGMIYYSQGAYNESVLAFEESVRLSDGDDWAKVHLAMALAKINEPGKSLNLLNRLLEDAELKEILPVEIAMVYLSLEDYDQAMDLLEYAFSINANWMISLNMDPMWEELQGNKRFDQLMAKMNFPD